MDVVKRIKDFDDELYLTFDIEQKLDFYIVGGNALYLHNVLSRPTLDIDAFFRTNIYEEIYQIMQRYDINTRAEMFDANFPHDFKSRAILKDFDTQVLNIYVLSIEDLVISKLVSGRPKDLLDIRVEEIIAQLDWELLKILKEDKLGDLLNDRIQDDFIYEYDKFAKGCCL